MSVFILETDAVTSAASSINSLASEMTNISSSVSGYDTSCEDGFNFAGAKSVIAGNLEACATKIKNTAKVMESVVSAHTELQGKLKFQDPSVQQRSDSSSGGSSSGGSSYSGGGSYYSGGGGGSYYSGGGGSSYTPAVPTPTKEKEKEKDKTGVVTLKLKKIGYAYTDTKNLSDETKKLMKDKEFDYDKEGYAKIGDRYVITCDSSIANVGDVLRFKQEDGEYIECVVGVTTVTEKYKNTINFLIDEEAESIRAIDLSKTLLKENKKVVNMGSLEDVRKEELVKAMKEAEKVKNSKNGQSTETKSEDVVNV